MNLGGMKRRDFDLFKWMPMFGPSLSIRYARCFAYLVYTVRIMHSTFYESIQKIDGEKLQENTLVKMASNKATS